LKFRQLAAQCGGVQPGCSSPEVVAGTAAAAIAAAAGMQGQVDTAYLAAANYLKTIGFTNTAEIARVLDIAMNPNSLFVQYNDAKRSTNVNVSCLSV
jgi:hypothetical protein